MTLVTDRARRNAVAELVSLREPGGFDLPPELVRGVEVFEVARKVTVPEPPEMRHPESAAGVLVDRLYDGQDADPVALAAELAVNREEAARVDEARQVVALAVEQAGDRAAATAARLAGDIIAGLQAAYRELLVEAEQPARTVGGYQDSDGWNAPPKVRTARAELARHVDRFQALWQARERCVGLAGQEPQHDVGHAFRLLAKPQVLHPDWSADSAAPLPATSAPSEPLALLPWLVTDAKAAGPHLPTVEQQDQCWWSLFGGRVEQLQAGALAARAYAGQAV